MAALVYRNVKIVVNGLDMSAELSELTVQTATEMLDATTFGASTRKNQGGLHTASISVSGYVTLGADLAEDVLFEVRGADGTAVAVFQEGITEGDLCGYAMLSTVPEFTMGGAVGVLTPFSASFEHQGVM